MNKQTENTVQSASSIPSQLCCGVKLLLVCSPLTRCTSALSLQENLTLQLEPTHAWDVMVKLKLRSLERGGHLMRLQWGFFQKAIITSHHVHLVLCHSPSHWWRRTRPNLIVYRSCVLSLSQSMPGCSAVKHTCKWDYFCASFYKECTQCTQLNTSHM